MQKLFFIHNKKDTFRLISNFDFDQNQTTSSLIN